jgi:hypothetical protein
MKYIITESRLNNLVFSYLNNQDWRTWDIGDGEFNVADGEFGKDLIRLRIQYSSTIPDRSFDVIYIADELVSQIIKLFGLSNSDAITSIISWFNQKYEKDLTLEDFEWLDNDGEYYADDDDEDY